MARQPQWALASSVRFHIHTRQYSSGEWSARRRVLYLTKHSTHKRQTSMPPAGFEAPIAASERPQTQTLHGAATGLESKSVMKQLNS